MPAVGRTVVNLFFLLSQWHPGKRQSCCKAGVFPSSHWERDRKTGHQSNAGHTHHSLTHLTIAIAHCWEVSNEPSLRVYLFHLSLWSIIWERTQTGGPWPCRTILRLLRISRSTFMVVQLNETPMHHYHPSINKNCLSVIELNLSSHEFSICVRKNTLDWSSHFIRRGSETQDRPADKLQWLT